MAAAKSDRYKDYIRYAEHCLNLVPIIGAQKNRAINREMAAEWIRLAEAIAHPLTPVK